jgi:hypothetical protein
MGTFATRMLVSILIGLLASSCGTVREGRQPDGEQIVFLPRAPRALASPVVDELELRRALEELLPDVNVEETRAGLRRMVADLRFHGGRADELRVALASWGSGPATLEEIGRGYRAWCAAVQRTTCFQGPLTDSSVYEIAFDFAMGSQWDGFVGELKSTIDPSMIRIVLLTGLVIFMATIAVPELTSKIPAAVATAILTGYLGARAVCDLVFGWIQMVRELDAATTFDQVRSAGQRYGRVVGAQTARILVLLATAAIARGGLIARLMKLPRASQASAALAVETGGVGLEVVGTVKGVRVLQGGVALALPGAAKGAVGVAMTAHGPGPASASSTSLPGQVVPGEENVADLLRRLPPEQRERLLSRIVRGDGKGRPFGTPRNPRMPTVEEFNPRLQAVRAGDLETTITGTRHGLHPRQTEAMRALSNEDLVRFRLEDPISGTGTGRGFSVTGGHHRLAEIIQRAKSGQMSPETPIRILFHD